MHERRNRMSSRVVSAILGHQNGRVRIDAEKVRGASYPFNLSLGKVWQPRLAESLFFAERGHTLDHHFGIVAGFREDRVRKPAHLCLEGNQSVLQ